MRPYWTQALPKFLVARGVVHGSGSTGAFHRSAPTGAFAHGTPLHDSVSVVVVLSLPAITPKVVVRVAEGASGSVPPQAARAKGMASADAASRREMRVMGRIVDRWS